MVNLFYHRGGLHARENLKEDVMKNSYDCSFVETRTNAEDSVDSAERMAQLAVNVAELMMDAADSPSDATGHMAGAAAAIVYLLGEAADCLMLTKQEIRKLDPPRALTDQEAAERLAGRAAS